MDNLHRMDKHLPTINPMTLDKNNNPPKPPPGMKAYPPTRQTTSENPEYLLLGQGIHHKESPNTRKKRAPSSTYVPNDVRFPDSHFVPHSSISRPAVTGPPTNKAYTHNPAIYVSEAPISSPQGPLPRFAAFHNPTADTSQYSASSHPNSSRNTPPRYISADPIVGYMSGAQISQPGRPHSRFTTVQSAVTIARQYPASGYRGSFSHNSYNFLGDMSTANISPPERFRPSTAAIHNPTSEPRQYPVDSYPSSPRNSSYSPHSHIPPAPISPLPHYNTPHSPAAITPQYPVSSRPNSPRNSPPERPRPYFATLHNPATVTPQHLVFGSYPNDLRNMGSHEPAFGRHAVAPKVDIAIAMTFQTISTRWVRTECARKMAAKLNEIEERHAEGAQRFAALMESLEENTLAGSRNNDQLDADSTDPKSQNTQDPVPATEARPAANTSSTPEASVSPFVSSSRPDENDSHNEDHLATLCRIC